MYAIKETAALEVHVDSLTWQVLAETWEAIWTWLVSGVRHVEVSRLNRVASAPLLVKVIVHEIVWPTTCEPKSMNRLSTSSWREDTFTYRVLHALLNTNISMLLQQPKAKSMLYIDICSHTIVYSKRENILSGQTEQHEKKGSMKMALVVILNVQ